MRPGGGIEIWGQRSPEGRLSLAEGHPRAGLGGNFGENGPRIGGLFMDLLGRFASWKGQTEFVKLQVALYSRDDPYE
mgnify:CR=1 FL=1